VIENDYEVQANRPESNRDRARVHDQDYDKANVLPAGREAVYRESQEQL
jgi:hypothetical protein